MGRPKWFTSAIIYQIYPRVYGMTDRRFGTLRDIQRDLPRIKSLGVNTLYLLPIHPITQKYRKGLSGSPYAVRDYLAVAPELAEWEGKGCDGSRDSARGLRSEAALAEAARQQFRELVREAHGNGLRVLLDFVGNHCAPDNVLLDPANPPEKGGYHPEWFLWDDDSRPLAPSPDWWDTADLNYGIPVEGKPNAHRLVYGHDENRRALWQFMAGVLEHWVREFDIDGYRCDFAHWVPLDFWRETIPRVKAIKADVVFIAEAYERMAELLAAGFDGIYAFELYNQLKSLHKDVRHNDPYYEVQYIRNKIEWENSRYLPGHRMVRYTENHDEPRTVVTYGGIERAKPPVLLALTLPGVPMLYAGQENGASIRPPLFEGNFEATFSPIDFSANASLESWYRHVLAIRSAKGFLHSDEIRFLPVSSRKVTAFLRREGEAMAIVIINFNAEPPGEWVEWELPPEVLQACAAGGGELVDLLAEGPPIPIAPYPVQDRRVAVYLRPLQSLILEMREKG
ncbi:alpha amylase catalytic region, putative [Heliomicrobium modesticaldum Ice1]|uniref:Alpha amylase catalytic region, putative n=1 Tax=Heliobacterium modesticaldum (strain ATCC 51547 / Ice1) TaxID=498761 RepID=B0TGL2_HELMI|nr:alpha-amylase family glycosyl hydrolase [Heliomicrobium modesticaldum]ABZ83273.1 alpha amylase catalytic region, putative [Heliomicrobium modesticaldum Ice1]